MKLGCGWWQHWRLWAKPVTAAPALQKMVESCRPLPQACAGPVHPQKPGDADTGNQVTRNSSRKCGHKYATLRRGTAISCRKNCGNSRANYDLGPRQWEMPDTSWTAAIYCAFGSLPCPTIPELLLPLRSPAGQDRYRPSLVLTRFGGHPGARAASLELGPLNAYSQSRRCTLSGVRMCGFRSCRGSRA